MDHFYIFLMPPHMLDFRLHGILEIQNQRNVWPRQGDQGQDRNVAANVIVGQVFRYFIELSNQYNDTRELLDPLRFRQFLGF